MTVMLTALAVLAQSNAAPVIEIENFVGRIRIEQGSELSARVEGDSQNQVALRTQTGAIYVDGGENTRRLNCYGRGGQHAVGRRRSNAVRFQDLPELIITTPSPASIDLGRSIFQAQMGEVQTLSVALSSCSTLRAGGVQDDVNLAASGSGEAIIGAVGGDLDAAISGSGDLRGTLVGGQLDLAISGSGHVRLDEITGAMNVSVSGSGKVETGHVARVSASISGSGEIEVGNAPGGVEFAASGNGSLSVGATTNVEVRSSGSSELNISSMNGVLDMSSNGSGEVRIEQGRASSIDATLGGSADLWFGGVADTVTARVGGGADVYIRQIQGQRNVRTSGGGEFRTGR